MTDELQKTQQQFIVEYLIMNKPKGIRVISMGKRNFFGNIVKTKGGKSIKIIGIQSLVKV